MLVQITDQAVDVDEIPIDALKVNHVGAVTLDLSNDLTGLQATPAVDVACQHGDQMIDFSFKRAADPLGMWLNVLLSPTIQHHRLMPIRKQSVMDICGQLSCSALGIYAVDLQNLHIFSF